MKKELLSPVGNFASLKAAIHNGADAVYLGGKKFGARAFADNFNEEEMIEAIEYCHLYGVKIYVTVNTMIYESEIDSCINYIRFLHRNNVDAVIMQDLGLISLIRELFPNLEIHASTQMHNHNIEQLKLLENLGVKRVVLARELTLEEIKKIKTKMEIEVFIHGALCISYSGQCLFSSLVMNRSGNRGSCAGMCRLPFQLIEDSKEITTKGNYLLSPKELNTLECFQEIMNSPIYSLKIEGRMKSPQYVGFVTKLYRMRIDHFQEKKKMDIKQEHIKNLASLYNRGFTKGHLFKAQDSELMNMKTSNHQGTFLGEVINITKEKIKLKIVEDLHQEDGIRFCSEEKGLIVNFLYNENGLLVNKVTKNHICFIDNKIGLTKKGKILKTMDSALMKNLEKITERKIPVTFIIEALLEKPLKISICDGINQKTCFGEIVKKAQTQAITKEIIKEKIGLLGNTPFKIEKLKLICEDGIFLSMSELKKIRRKIVEDLINDRKMSIPHIYKEKEMPFNKKKKKEKKSACFINALVRNEEQLQVCLEENINTIYVTEEELYRKYKKYGKIYLRLSRVMQTFKEYENEKLLVGESGSLFKYGKANQVVADYYFNVANHYTDTFLKKLGAERTTLSIENTKEEIESILENMEWEEKIELYLYGKPEVMIMKHCPLKMHINKETVCHVCQNNKKYYLKDRNDKLYRLLPEPKENHLTHLFHYKNIDLIEQIQVYQQLGINHFRVEFLDETKEEVKTIICKIRNCQI